MPSRPVPILVLSAVLGLLSAGCTPRTPYHGVTPFPDTDAGPNRAPRGSREFCRTYGKQTAANRAESSGFDGHGPNGLDIQNAKREGERADRRCLSGRTN